MPIERQGIGGKYYPSLEEYGSDTGVFHQIRQSLGYEKRRLRRE